MPSFLRGPTNYTFRGQFKQCISWPNVLREFANKIDIDKTYLFPQQLAFQLTEAAFHGGRFVINFLGRPVGPDMNYQLSRGLNSSPAQFTSENSWCQKFTLVRFSIQTFCRMKSLFPLIPFAKYFCCFPGHSCLSSLFNTIKYPNSTN